MTEYPKCKSQKIFAESERPEILSDEHLGADQIAAPNRCMRLGPVPWSFGTLLSQRSAVSSHVRRHYTIQTYLQIALSLAICICGAGCLSGPSRDERSPEVRGRVVDAKTQQPIADATIALQEHPSLSVLSDTAGCYRLRATHNVHLVTFLGICSSDFPAGKYYGDGLQVSHPLYQTEEIHARQYRDARWTNSTVLVLRDVLLVPIAK